MLKNPPANAGDARDRGSVPGCGRSPGGGKDNPFQYSCLENSVDRGAWWATVDGVPKIEQAGCIKSWCISQSTVTLMVVACEIPRAEESGGPVHGVARVRCDLASKLQQQSQ